MEEKKIRKATKQATENVNQEIGNPEDLQKKLMMLSEQYNNVVNQARVMAQKLNEMQLQNAFKRLEFLFKVIEYQDVFSDEFIERCINEIEDTLTLTPSKEEESDEEA